MAGGKQTARAWAGISSDWDQAQKMEGRGDRFSLHDDFEDALLDKDRRQRLLERIRREERAAGIHHPEKFEDKYDRWANDAVIA